jgi:hypothetical protein
MNITHHSLWNTTKSTTNGMMQIDWLEVARPGSLVSIFTRLTMEWDGTPGDLEGNAT